MTFLSEGKVEIDSSNIISIKVDVATIFQKAIFIYKNFSDFMTQQSKEDILQKQSHDK